MQRTVFAKHQNHLSKHEKKTSQISGMPRDSVKATEKKSYISFFFVIHHFFPAGQTFILHLQSIFLRNFYAFFSFH